MKITEMLLIVNLFIHAANREWKQSLYNVLVEKEHWSRKIVVTTGGVRLRNIFKNTGIQILELNKPN